MIWDRVVFWLVAVINVLTAGHRQQRSLGQSCDDSDDHRYAYFIDEQLVPEKYLYCDKRTKQLESATCPFANGHQRVFDEITEQCLQPQSRNRRHLVGSGRVGDACRENIDCVNGSMFCSNGLCTCLSDYVAINGNGYCYPKINPEQSGCQFEEQCSSVWPQATCNDQGVCRCPNSQPLSVTTRDGIVCISSADPCPLPYDAIQQQVALTVGGVQQTCTTERNDFSCRLTGIPDENTGIQHTYDCIQPPTAASGVCCPSRAFTCILPHLSTAEGAGTPQLFVNRWAYNSITGTCHQFAWDQYGANNANNFETIDQCISYCATTCRRGLAQTSSQQRITCNAGACNGDFACQTIGSRSVCCSRNDYICSPRGGLPTVVAATGSDGGNPGIARTGTVTRYYYNTASRICQTFQWNQQNGDFNNFASQQDCQSYCGSALCEQGEPIKDGNNQNQVCGGSGSCPSTHSCTNGVCCPKKQFVCAQDKLVGTPCVGPIGSNAFRWFYNAATGECEQFTFNGCNGNNNNFESQLKCQQFCRGTNPKPSCIQGDAYKDPFSGSYVTTCSINPGVGRSTCPLNYECYFDGFLHGCCPTKAYVCGQTIPDRGQPCGPQVTKWYFDSMTKTCSTFTYLGCNGNPNNFPNRELCETYCNVGGCPYGGQMQRDSSGAIVACDSTQTTCSSDYVCVDVTIGTTVQSRCCPGRGYICSQPPASGTVCGTGAIQRYYYNQASKQCQTFSFNGCGNNGNNFGTKAQCEDFCKSAACALGEAVFTNQNTNLPQTCNINVQNNCPNNFRCTFDAYSQLYVCCGATDMGVCPLGEKAFVDPLTLGPRNCLPNIGTQGGCSGNYLCRSNQQQNGYFCCANAAGGRCPIGKVLLKNSENRSTVCPINNVVNLCSVGYSCQSPVAGTNEGHCCSVLSACANGGDFEKDATETPKSCTLNVGFGTQCSLGYVCQRSLINPNSVTGYCCSLGGGTSNVCPLGQQVELLNGTPRTCIPGQFSGCSTNFNCCQYANTGVYYCCGAGGGQFGGDCPAGMIGPNPPQLCAGPNAVCPNGYTCQNVKRLNSYRCCGINGGCPGNSIAYILSSGQPQSCSAVGQPSNCPTGFTCQQASMGPTCCSGGGGNGSSPECPPGQTTFPVQSCTVGGMTRGGCPDGYNCINSQRSGQPICCGNQAPNNGCLQGRPYMYPGTNQPLACPANSNRCPSPYQCVFAPARGYWQCCPSFREMPTSNATSSEGDLYEDLKPNVESEYYREHQQQLIDDKDTVDIYD